MSHRFEDWHPHTRQHLDTPVYTVTIYLAAPGTLIKDENGKEHTSMAGHAYYAISDGSEQIGYGFSPIETGVRGPGRIVKDEQRRYQNPAYARTLEIPQAQYDKLKQYGEAGVDKQQTYFQLDYDGASNSCIDFVWKGLNHAGLPTHIFGSPGPSVPYPQFEGEMKVLDNIARVRKFQAPIPDSPHNQEETHPIPKERNLLQRILTEAEPGPAPGLPLPASLQDIQHPGHRAFQQALDSVQRMETEHGIASGPHSEQLAAALAVKAAQEGMALSNLRLHMGSHGQLNIVEQGYYASEPAKHYTLASGQALAQSMQQHTSAWQQARSPHYASQAPAAERSAEHLQSLQRLSSHDRALFDGYRHKLPAHIPDEQVFKAMLQGRQQANIHRPEQLGLVTLRGDYLFIKDNSPAGLGTRVDLAQPAPSLHESLEHHQAQNQQWIQQQTVDAQQREQQGRTMRAG